MKRFLFCLVQGFLIFSCSHLLPVPDDAAFFSAIKSGDEKVVDRYLNGGGDPNVCNRYGDSALCWAANQGDSRLVSRLLELGADPERSGAGGRNPIHWACSSGSEATLAALLQGGARLDALDHQRMSPLMIAARDNRLSCLDLLISQGADLDRVDLKGFTALMYALHHRNAEVIEHLILAGADAEAGVGKSALSLALETNLVHLFQTEKIQARFPDIGRKLTRKRDNPKPGIRNEQALAADDIANRETVFVDDVPLYDQERLLDLLAARVNQIRQCHGLKPLSPDSELDRVARSHCEDMVSRKYFSISNPEGLGPGDRFLRQKSDKSLEQSPNLAVYENLFRVRLFVGTSEYLEKGVRVIERNWLASEELVDQILESWQGEEQTRAALLLEGAAHQGFGLVIDRSFNIIVAQVIARLGEDLAERVLNEDERPDMDAIRLARLVAGELNQLRRQRGLLPLNWDPILASAALEHSQDMVLGDYLDHRNRAGEFPTQRAERHGLSTDQQGTKFHFIHGIGENINRRAVYANSTIELRSGEKLIRRNWLSEEELARVLIEDFARDPGNLNNMVSQLFERQGTGIAFDTRNRVYVTQKFAMVSMPDLKDYQVVEDKPAPEVLTAGFVQMIHRLINEQRLAHGLKTLAWDAELAEIADLHSADMARQNYFSHRDKRGGHATDRAMRRGYHVLGSIGTMVRSGIGENIYRDHLYSGLLLSEEKGQKQVKYQWYEPETLARTIVTGWMNSPGHRANILNSLYEREGIGVAKGKDESLLVTQNFY